MATTRRYCLILIWLCAALTGYGQNQRMSSLQVTNWAKFRNPTNIHQYGAISSTNRFEDNGGRLEQLLEEGGEAFVMDQFRIDATPNKGRYQGNYLSNNKGQDFFAWLIRGDEDGNSLPRFGFLIGSNEDKEHQFRDNYQHYKNNLSVPPIIWYMDALGIHFSTNGAINNLEGVVTFPEQAAPATPAAGKVALYVKTDGKAYIKDDAGTETDLTATAAGGSGIATLNGTGTNTSFVDTKTNYITAVPSSSASAIYEKWFAYTNNANSLLTAPFAMTLTAVPNVSGTRSNVVMSWGYNPMTDGNKLVATEPSMVFNWETHYNPSGTALMEFYPRFDPMGTSLDWRPWMITFSTNSGASRSMVVNCGSFSINDNTATSQITVWSSFGSSAGDGGTVTHTGTITQNARNGGAPSHRINDRGWIEMHNTAETVSYLLRPHADETSFILGINSGSTHSGVMMDVALATSPATVSLTADNQTVNLTNKSYIQLSSTSATATQRTFVLTPTVAAMSGQTVTLEWTGTNAGEIADDSANTGGGNTRLSAIWTPTQYDTLTLRFNGTDWVEMNRSAN